MAKNKLDIKSSTVNKGLDIAKNFLGKLIAPAIEEVGLLMSDQVKYLRFKNQVKILLKAEKFAKKRKIKIKELPIKIIAPFLESASLEESEELQDKWAKMLTNMIDSRLNFRNQIFPFILSQISIQEFTELNKLCESQNELMAELKLQINKQEASKRISFSSIEGRKRGDFIKQLEETGFILKIENIEISNILRLGLIQQLPPPLKHERSHSMFLSSSSQNNLSKVSYDIHSIEYRITALGVKFVEVCSL